MNFSVPATMIPMRTGKGMAASQRKSPEVAGAARIASMAPSPPALFSVPQKRRTAAMVITIPCTASVFTTEMNPPTAV